MPVACGGLATGPTAEECRWTRRDTTRLRRVSLQKGNTLLTNGGVWKDDASPIVGITAQMHSGDTPDVSHERKRVVGKNVLIAYGLAGALFVPGASALAAGGQGATHRAAPAAAAHGHQGGAHGAARGRDAAHRPHLRPFEGVIVTVAADSLALRVQGRQGVTVTVGFSLTGTRVTADDSVTTTAALASGEQVYVAAVSATTNAVTTYTAVRIAIQRPEANAQVDTDNGSDTAVIASLNYSRRTKEAARRSQRG